MGKIIDVTHHYKPPWSGVQAHCRLRLYDDGERTIVLWAEQADNRGMSVTTMPVSYRLAPTRTTFIEHYPAEKLKDLRREATYDLVTFDWQAVEAVFNRVLWTQIAGVGVKQIASNPQWRRLTIEEVERMIGE